MALSRLCHPIISRSPSLHRSRFPSFTSSRPPRQISWDVTVENSHVVDADDTNLLSTTTNSNPIHHYTETGLTGSNRERSRLMETEYRNKILDDLFEAKAFLNQRYLELMNGETLSLQHQIQAVAPFVLQQYSPDSIQAMLSDVSLAISLLTNRKTRDLILLLNSKRYL